MPSADHEIISPNLPRHLNCLGDENRNTRKRALEAIRKETVSRSPALSTEDLGNVFQSIGGPLLKLFSDPVEKCRELSIDIIGKFLEKVPSPSSYLHVVVPVVTQRLGQQDIVEPSEELRLELIVLLTHLVELSGRDIHPYLDDLIKILQRSIVDPYPEVKKQSCKCASIVAKAIPDYFHMQSESLIKPLLTSISHQHSKVRVETILAIGNVIQYGNGKSVDDVVSHLAQRLFDQNPQVRLSVTRVIGGWLLNLMDRYSFFHKLIPLLLTSITDELPDICSEAEALWHDVGLKYEGENEDDLKDQQDFIKGDPDHYPPGVERPNLGCRTLMYRNFSKIMSGLTKDITDWVVGTRVKSAQLMYTMLLNEEENTTQHLEKVLGGMYRASMDEEPVVREYVAKSAELVGFFVPPEVWVKMVLDHVKASQSPSSVLILSAIIRGSHRTSLKPHLEALCSVLADHNLCQIADAPLQTHLLSSVESLLRICGEDCSAVSLKLFSVLISICALHRQDSLLTQAHELLNTLASQQNLSGTEQLFEMHTHQMLSSMKEHYMQWAQHSTDRLIFDTLIMSSGPVVGRLLDDVLPIMAANLNPDKDPEVRLKFFSLLSRLLLNAPKTLNSENRFANYGLMVVRDMILPNCVWKAGRTAAAIRTTALSCLWALLQSQVLQADQQLMEVLDDLCKQLRSNLDDDKADTRLLSCRVLSHLLTALSTRLDQHFLHNLYPDLLKRLDDSSDNIRRAMCATLMDYFDCFESGFNVNLYRAHLEEMYKGLMVHLDDPDSSIQDAVLDVLKKASHIEPSHLMQEIDSVRHKHRSTKYCDDLAAYIQSTNQ
ncbi:hypothetical protein CAPTEDRAFT_167239 [Capitella teleta]|uniref:TOG domain-containing protein n=1 Tax=Capitella teleta TaxID=283909 RepID=R7UI93_CAPTE|nr:hypothetical protein CAPTEDRAFT_167239 [Capitella teleta]|eukprot:ELU05823.1 hypothetical protein CAPTEDRAFT_167239 [Capitella teleta]